MSANPGIRPSTPTQALRRIRCGTGATPLLRLGTTGGMAGMTIKLTPTTEPFSLQSDRLVHQKTTPTRPSNRRDPSSRSGSLSKKPLLSTSFPTSPTSRTVQTPLPSLASTPHSSLLPSPLTQPLLPKPSPPLVPTTLTSPKYTPVQCLGALNLTVEGAESSSTSVDDTTRKELQCSNVSKKTAASFSMF